jgi:hypothetical protein
MERGTGNGAIDEAADEVTDETDELDEVESGEEEPPPQALMKTTIKKTK